MSDFLSEIMDSVGNEYFLKNSPKAVETLCVLEQLNCLDETKVYPDFDHVTMV